MDHESVSSFLRERLSCSGKSTQQVADECGYGSARVIEAMVSGDVKVPVKRIGSLAAALGTDPGDLLRLVLKEYLPDLFGEIERAWGNASASRTGGGQSE